MLRLSKSRPASMRGVTLVELMVALVAGLIVIGAVLALVVSIMRSNRETLQATRLNQELRATMAVVEAEVRRARAVEDPLTSATATGGNIYRTINTSTANCIRYSYSDSTDVNGDGVRNAAEGVDDSGSGVSDDDDFHAIYLANDGKVMRGSVNKPGPATCGSGGLQLGSNQVFVTALTFNPAIATTTVREFTLTLTGHLVDTNADLANINRTITQTIYVRSVGQ